MGSSSGSSEPSRRIPRKSQRAPFERRVLRLVALLVVPGLLVSGILVWLQPWTVESKLVVLGIELLLCFLIGAALHDHIVRPLQTLANVVGSLREEDYSFRARMAVPNDALGELSLEVNALADLLSRHRTGTIEAAALLERVVEEVDIPILAFDPGGRLKLVNSAGERLLQKPSGQLLDRTATDLGLQSSLTCDNETLLSLRFASGTRWVVRRSSFRQQGIPHTLVVLSDVSRALREQERLAWQRLIRVIGHELNNSLAPIKSIAGSLNAQLSKTGLDDEQRQDFERGLAIIEARAASLNRFLQAYRQLAQMPPPELQPCSISALVTHVAALETRVRVNVVPGPDVTLLADLGQLEQMLINLLRNAAEAALGLPPPGESSVASENAAAGEPGAQVTVTWKLIETDVVITIEDNGPGLMNPSNAFVPFYTTKPQGSGIGLVLSRQIVEAHGGTIEVANRRGHRGCEVKITLPRA
jgi:two-component system, NtrC family, nitrogen regulation sensor histidine kinase NtrY